VILIEAQGEIVDGRDHHEHGACDEDAEPCEFQRFVLGHWCPRLLHFADCIAPARGHYQGKPSGAGSQLVSEQDYQQ
jgi:hypothetical protein